MKKFLHLVTILTMIAIPQWSMAETDYGILVAGTRVTSDNAANITSPDITQGKVTYDASTNTLTLTSVTMATTHNGIQVSNSAKDHLHIVIKGYNLFKKVQGTGAAISIQKSRNPAGTSSPNCFIEGTGTLTLEENGIMCMEAPWLCIGSGADGDHNGEGCVTINANSIYCRSNSPGGILSLENGCVNLSGFSFGTVYGFNEVHARNNDPDYPLDIFTPEGASYDTANMYMADGNGDKVTGPLYMGWKKYGLKINGMEIHAGNRDDIRDWLNNSPTIMNLDFDGQLDKGSLTYNPTTRTLTMKNVCIFNSNNRTYPKAPLIENTGDGLIINCKAKSSLISVQGVAISTTKNLEFSGSANLNIGTLTEGSNAIQMEGSNRSIQFDNCDVTISALPNSYSLWASPENRYRLYIDQANLIIGSPVTGIDYYRMTNAGIATPEVYIQPANDNCPGYFCKFGEGEYNDWGKGITIQATTENYGIQISGHELNYVNKENFYFEDIVGGTVKYDPISNFLWLDNVQATCTQKNIINRRLVEDWHPNGIVVSSKAKPDLRIIFNGENTFSNIEGVGIVAQQDIRFESWGAYGGTLDIGNHSIVSYGGSDLEFTDGCIVKAGRIYGSEGNGGYVLVSGASLYLTGNGKLPTIRGISDLFVEGAKMIIPENPEFTGYELQVDGSAYTGEVYILQEKFYGIALGSKTITNMNQADVLGDGTVSFREETTDNGTHKGYLYLNNAQIPSINAFITTPSTGLDVYYDIDRPLDELTIVCSGTSTVQAQSTSALYNEVPILNIVSEDGKGKLILNSEQANGIEFANNGDMCWIEDCDVEINAGKYGIYAPYESSENDQYAWTHYTDVTIRYNHHKTRLTVNTQKYGGSENLKNICLDMEGYDPPEIVQPAGAFITNAHQIVDAEGNTLSGQILEIVMHNYAAVSVEDITELIDRYLEPGSTITVEDITNLIDLYLEQ